MIKAYRESVSTGVVQMPAYPLLQLLGKAPVLRVAKRITTACVNHGKIQQNAHSPACGFELNYSSIGSKAPCSVASIYKATPASPIVVAGLSV